MVAVFLILLVGVYLAFFFPVEPKVRKKEEESPKQAVQMKKLWQIAQTSIKERKPLRAEKALLAILKFDEKNAAAYNRLGILYAKGGKYDEAVECFEIAQSLDNNPASIHNVGLIYLETGEYEKAAMAFSQAIALEGDVAARHIALAKAEEKMGNFKKAVNALEDAYELDPKVATLRQILAIYEGTGETEAATATSARIEEQIVRDNEAKRQRAVRMARASGTRGHISRMMKQPKKRAKMMDGANRAAKGVAGGRAVKEGAAKMAKGNLNGVPRDGSAGEVARGAVPNGVVSGGAKRSAAGNSSAVSAGRARVRRKRI